MDLGEGWNTAVAIGIGIKTYENMGMKTENLELKCAFSSSGGGKWTKRATRNACAFFLSNKINTKMIDKFICRLCPSMNNEDWNGQQSVMTDNFATWYFYL